MNRFNLVSAAGLFVLTAGLASCSQDQTTKDSYKAPPPVIVTGKGQQNFLQWERSSDKTLDLQDAFDVSAGNPVRTEITAHCMRDKVSYSEKFSVNGLQAIKIFQVVPQDILFEILSQTDVSCDWEISLYNELGSRHVIRLPAAPISDRGDGEVIAENSVNGQSLKTVRIFNSDGIKIRYRNSERASAEIICSHVRFEALSFERVLDLSQFNLHHPIYRPGRTEADVARQPLQSCRIAISENGKLKQISSRLTLHIPRKPLEVRLVKILNPAPFTNINQFHSPTGVADISIVNSTEADRTIQVPRLLLAHYDLLLRNQPPQGVAVSATLQRNMGLPAQYIHIHPVNAVQVTKEEEAGWTIVIPAKSTLNLRGDFQLPTTACRRSNLMIIGFTAHPSPLKLNEVMPSGERLQTLDIKFPEFEFGMNPTAFQNSTAAAGCF